MVCRGFVATYKQQISHIKKGTPDGAYRSHGQDKAHSLDPELESWDVWPVKSTISQGAQREQLSQKRQREVCDSLKNKYPEKNEGHTWWWRGNKELIMKLCLPWVL